MRMCREACSGGDTVFVQNAEASEVLKAAVEVVGETECMVGVQPAVIGMSAVSGASEDDLGVGKRL